METLKETAPWLVAGLAIVLLFQALPIPTEIVTRFLQSGDGASNGIGLCFRASLLGLCVPLCSCGVLPMAVLLRRYGVPAEAIASFVTAAQSAGLDSLMTTIGVLGAKQALARLATALVFAMAAGLALGCMKLKPETDNHNHGCCDDHDKPQPANKRHGLQAVLHWLKTTANTVLDAWEDVVPWVLVGVVFTNACTRYVSKPASEAQASLVLSLSSLVGEGEAVQQVVQGLLSTITRCSLFLAVMPLQLCEHGTAAFSAGLVKAGASQGTAFAFLVLAPATNLATLGMLAGAAGSRAAVTLGFALVLAALAVSVVVDAMNSWGWIGEGLTGSVHGSQLPSWFEVVTVQAAVTLVALSVVRRVTRLFGSQSKAKTD